MLQGSISFFFKEENVDKNVKPRSCFFRILKLSHSDMQCVFSFQIKKLVYVYLMRYAEEQQDLALLSISTFQRALKVSDY